MLLVFYAFPREIAVLKRRLGGGAALDQGRELDGFRAPVAGFGEAVFIATGIGPRRAREAARRALSAFPEARLVIGAGVAGALSAGLAPGDIVIADRVLSMDVGGAPCGLALDASARLHCERALRSAGLGFSVGAVLTSSRPLARPQAKRAAGVATGALAVDMESAELALETAARGAPFAVVRAIMDGAGDEVFGAELADERGCVRPLAAAAYLAANPRAFVKILRMMRNLGRAAKTLAGAVTVLGASPWARDAGVNLDG